MAKAKASTPRDGETTAPPPSSAKPTLDLARYARSAGTAASTATTAEATAPAREQFPLVKWSDLAGIDGMTVTDVWAGTSKPKVPGGPTYEYVGVNLRMPDGAEATALTGTDTVAGGAIVAAMNAQRFDAFDKDGAMVPVPVHVRNRPSPVRVENGKKVQGKPMSFLTFG